VEAGSGGAEYIWPGVPLDLPGALAFFAARGWTSELDVLDLTLDLRGYRPPEGTALPRIEVGCTAAVLAFEREHFPQWVRFFADGGDAVLAALDASGEVVGTLLFDGPVVDDPDRTARYGPMLGPASGEIGCVGVAPHVQGRGIGTALVVRASELLSAAGTRTCHIGWAVRERFYGRAGYRPWRRYRMVELAGGVGTDGGAAPPASR
jgi:beta-N-acetylhexosaminidase